MMKLYIILISILVTITIKSYSQTNWEYIGVFNEKDIYYDKSSVVRGTYTYVLVKGKPKAFVTDDAGKEFEYLTVNCIFYKNFVNQIRCVISDRIYYYSDNTFRKSAMPKIEVSLNYAKVINDLYNKIR